MKDTSYWINMDDKDKHKTPSLKLKDSLSLYRCTFLVFRGFMKKLSWSYIECSNLLFFMWFIAFNLLNMAKHAMLATFSAGTILKNYLLQKLAHNYELMRNNLVRQIIQSLTFFVYCVVVVGECHSTYHRTCVANNFSVCM